MTSSSSAGCGRATVEGATRGRYGRWVVGAALVTVAGLVSAVLAASAVASAAADSSALQFKTASAQIVSTLGLAIQHEEDLTVSLNAFYVSNPNATNAQFRAWTRSMRAFERYPELMGLGRVNLVTSAQLPAFIVKATADPDHPLGNR